jgi:predicted MFS family arabinose efflux permease
MNRNLVLLTLSLVTWGTGESMFLYFQPLYLQKLGADPVKIGVILGIAGIATVCVHIPAGYLADRYGRRPLIWSSWILGLFAAWTMALAKSLPIFVGGMVIYSCTYFVMAPMNSYITAARGRWSVGRALTVVMAAFSFGSILGPYVGGRVADQVGLNSIFFISGSIFILSTCIVFFLQAQPLDHAAANEPNGGMEINRRYLAFLGIVFISMFIAYLPQPLSSNFLHNVRGLSYSQIGQLGSISSLGMVVLSLAMGRLNHHVGFIIGQAAVGLFTLLLWQGNAFLLYAAGYFFMGGFRVAHSFASAQTNELVHQSRMGLAYGLTETVFSIALMLAPPLAGYLYAIQPSLTYSVSFVLILLTLVLLAIYYYRPHTRLSPHEERSLEA